MRNSSSSDKNTVELSGLAHYLFHDGLVDITTIQQACATAAEQAIPLTRYLIAEQVLSSHTLLNYCATTFGLPIYHLKEHETWPKEPLIKGDLIYRYRVLPLNCQQNTLEIGITDPTDHTTLTALSFHTGLHIRPMLVDEALLHDIIETYYRPDALNTQLESTLSQVIPLEAENLSPENVEQLDEPLIQFVDHLLQDALQKNVSDIHIEPYETHCRVRFRRDGLLYEAATLPAHLATRIIMRLKILANLNIAERRKPQDGRIQLRLENKIDLRMNTCPTIFGEKIVLRILDNKNINLEIDALGLTTTQEALFLSHLKQPHGLILVTGPTGSGKTMTLYSALQYLNQVEKNISSVEDPVEIELNGINQVNINPRIGLDFATVLRTFLRQDPDIIMIGEIRDCETAEIAIQAAQTGHLVLSTLHTNSAAETFARLASFKVNNYHLAHSLSLIIAQRLLRKLCVHCKEPETSPNRIKSDFSTLQAQITYRAVGCTHCHQGYHGRVGIFELLPIAGEVAQLIKSQTSITTILEQTQKEGFIKLWEAGLKKINQA